jgi:hypothetical protein
LKVERTPPPHSGWSQPQQRKVIQQQQAEGEGQPVEERV